MKNIILISCLLVSNFALGDGGSLKDISDSCDLELGKVMIVADSIRIEKSDAVASLKGFPAAACPDNQAMNASAENALSDIADCSRYNAVWLESVSTSEQQCNPSSSSDVQSLMKKASNGSATYCKKMGHLDCSVTFEFIYTSDKQCAVIATATGVPNSVSACDQLTSAKTLLGQADLFYQKGRCVEARNLTSQASDLITHAELPDQFN